jgi:hypothetical protein
MSVSPSIRPSFRVEQLVSQWTDIDEIWYLHIFRKYVDKNQVSLHLTRITGTLHEAQYTFLVISLSVLFRMINISGQHCRENQNTYFMFSNFFRREEQRLEAAQMKFLRHLLGITKLDKEKNQRIREQTGAQNVVKEIK